ncbi:ABC transporter permease [Halalkalicoccus jeotgali]|uniref:ABC-type transport system permease n=1 Tax=Halalkalicoccus jeotgali (strain DSM 18796 / CECT 7217 / JCM 14584 / KCTC 4019 / B3) TaxID=795797 RepID=D8J572_HALJB|nr:ABC transporter permease [Halalkalicoccus jeotgali]ADJ13653.1 ABC-type transport system permease protein (probable substrate dipeptides/oligopeptides) [Halalkalicoccus jeotgali B3]ELY34300.1 ABC-type transport system permease [Halalkalicoccus jeotgali B3]
MAVHETQSEEEFTEEPSEGGVDEVEARVGLSYTLKQVKRDSTARMGFYIIAFITAVAAVVSVDYYLLDYAIAKSVPFFHHPERDPEVINTLLPPVGMENGLGAGTWEYPLGTDHRGRDIFTRLIYGTRIAMTVGFMATAIGLVGGTLVGAVSGYYGGWVDDVLQRITDTIYAIPFLVLVIAFMSAFGRDITYAMIGVGIASIPVFNRLIRSRVVSIREEEYIEAAKAAGVKDRNIIIRHIIPNSFAPVLVQATLQVGVSILIVAGLSFLGFGAQPPTPSWGQMLAASRNYMLPAPTFSIWPGIAILVTVVAFNLLGDGLQDALDPRINN